MITDHYRPVICHFVKGSCGLGTEKEEYKITTELYLLSCLLCPVQRVCWHQSYAPMQPLERWAAVGGWSLWSSDSIKSSGNDPLRAQEQLRTEETISHGCQKWYCLLPSQAIISTTFKKFLLRKQVNHTDQRTGQAHQHSTKCSRKCLLLHNYYLQLPQTLSMPHR